MIHFTWNNVLFLTIFMMIACISVTGQSVGDEAYAMYLFREEDYFRSITEWKKIDFYALDTMIKINAQKYISYCYLYSNKYKTSLQYLFRILDIIQSQQEKDFMFFLIGLNYYSLHVSILTEEYWASLPDTEYEWSHLPLLFKTMVAFKRNELDSAFDYLNHPSLSTHERENLKTYGLAILQEVKDASYYNPFLISMLSAIIPGSGQAVTGHMVDALQAFSFVALFGLATYGVYLYDSTISNNYIATGIGAGITVVFHLSNIVGAYKTAQYKNAYIRNTIIGKWEKYIWQETRNYIK